MEPFRTLRSVAAPLMRANVDTEIIIPMSRLVTAEASEMGRYAFEPWRYLESGEEDPEFVLNRRPFRGAQILLVGPNFGCGSSREGAVWALAGLGIRCLIGDSFGDIFFNNCFQNGILPIRLAAEQVTELARLAEEKGAEAIFEVDLENSRITSPEGEAVPFEIADDRRTQLLEGLDDIALTLKRSGDIAAFRKVDEQVRPWVYVDAMAWKG